MPEADPVDLLIVGGGINGAGIARDAAGRGLSVVLCEQDDLGGATSSASTKLIHGGLRYLETYEFRLVREALIEREVLLNAAPHIIWPLRFVLPHNAGLRPAWMVRIGLFLYDHLGGRKKLPGSYGLDLRSDPAGRPLKDSFTKAFCYSDCWVQDSRLVVLNAMDAAERGARISPRTRCTSLRRADGLWHAKLESRDGGAAVHLRARAVVNSAGPWVADVLGTVAGGNRESHLRLVKGSHIVVPRVCEGDHAYILQNDDRRIVFIIPYEGDYSLIGTTDVPFEGDPAEAQITGGEVGYLCAAVNRYLAKPIVPEDVVWSYAGVRPLYDDARANVSAVTRDYVFDIDRGANDDDAPMLSIFGGKITTYRKLAEHAMDKLLPTLGRSGPAWTERAVLPGGDIPDGDFDAYVTGLCKSKPWLPSDLAWRYARAYGTRTERLLNDAKDLADLGEDLGDGVHEAEITYLREHEWATTAEDVLWRRSKLGLHVAAPTRARLAAFFGESAPAQERVATR